MADDVRAGKRGARTGPALEAMYQLVRWLIPTVDRFPRRQKFLLGDRIQTTALAGPERQIEATFTRSRGGLLNRMSPPGHPSAAPIPAEIHLRAARDMEKAFAEKWPPSRR